MEWKMEKAFDPNPDVDHSHQPERVMPAEQ
jgi:hypothetical protein